MVHKMVDKVAASVYVLTYNNRGTIERCLKSLAWAEELAQEIQRELDGEVKDSDGFFIYRRTYYLGRWIRYGGWYPDGEIRLYRRDKGRWEGGLHAKVVVGGKVSVLKNKYLHYTYRDIGDRIQTMDRYSKITADDLFKK